MPDDTRTVIIGGGVIGVCSAYELARRGEGVTLIEAERIAAGASEGNAGQMAIAHPPLPRPGLAWRAARWMFDPKSPLLISPRAGWSMAPWLWTFWRSCSPRVLERSMALLAALGRLTRPMFDEIIERESIDCGYTRAGVMEVARTDAGAREGRDTVAMLRGLGVDAVWLDGGEVVEREPAFKAGVAGAAWNRESVSLDPARFTRGVAEAARRHGAIIRDRAPVRRLITRDGAVAGVELESGEHVPAARVVLAAGIASARLGRAAGVRLPMQAGKGYHREIEPAGPALTTPCVLIERFVACTPMNGRLRLAGTLEFTGVNTRMRRARLDALSNGADEYLKGVRGAAPGSEWCGLRPCTADGLPIVGPSRRAGGLIVATGHAMLGMTLGPATGRLVADLAQGRTPPVDLAPMSPDRF